MQPTTAARLAELLCKLFSAEELKLFILGTLEGEQLRHEWPAMKPPAGQAAWFVEAAERRGLIDTAWFDELTRVRAKRRAEIDTVRVAYLPRGDADRPAGAPPWRALPTAPAFLRPDERRSEGGLVLLDIHPRMSTDGVPLPVLRFTLKNESPGWATLIRVGLDATCIRSRAVFTMGRPLEPAARWDVAVPETGGSVAFQADPPIALPPGMATMVEIRLYVLRGGRDPVPPQHCGEYTLRFTFTTGEGAAASSEPIAC
ncbi:MAG: hypothetical protein H0T76_09935 [Nannocystis sp.]|nr:hypothetical protein [Nannocystis sp.]MBA3546790.1 hypothetical protein [Nannocystis sp.]